MCNDKKGKEKGLVAALSVVAVIVYLPLHMESSV